VQGTQYTQVLRARCGCLAHFLQPYFVASIFLLSFFVRTLWDVIRFEYIDYGFLNPDRFSDHPNPDSGSALTIPSYLRWISVLSPLAGVLTVVVAGLQTLVGIFQNEILESRANAFLHRVIVGMPLVFVTMAIRATIREWAVMTGSAWTQTISDKLAGASLTDRQEQWEKIEAQQIATYEQNLQVASAFQFFAVGCFTQLCSEALEAMVTQNANNIINDSDEQLSFEERRQRLQRDSRILRRLALSGFWAFVVLGLAKAVVTLIVGMISSDLDNARLVQPIHSKIMKMLEPVFLFATVLSVINMHFLGEMDAVKRVLPWANVKFHATRALLLIGQVQFSVLSAFITTNGTSPLLHALHKVKWHGKYPEFGIHQVRLLHSSLLCFECLIVAIVNFIHCVETEGQRSL